MPKRKYGVRNNIDENCEEEVLKNMITENLIDNILGNKKLKQKQDLFRENINIYREDNHIYFRTDVTIENCDLLLKLVREYEDDLKEYKSHPYIDDSTFKPPNLFIHLTTYGGDLYASFLVYDTLKKSKLHIITVAEGYVASAGTVMSLGGKERKIQKTAIMMIHQLRTVIAGKFQEIQEDFQNSKMDMKRLINLYNNELCGKMKKKEIHEALNHDIWWDAEMCIKKGLCHSYV